MEYIDAEYIVKNGDINKDISRKDASYSPLFSSVGLCCDESFSGIKELYLHYNRSSRCIFSPMLEFSEKIYKTKCSIDGIAFGEKAEISFYGRNMFLISCKDINSISLFKSKTENTRDFFKIFENENNVLFHGYSYNTDERDPDPTVPFCVGVKVLTGKCNFCDGVSIENENGKIIVAVNTEILSFSKEYVLNNLNNAPDNITKAKDISVSWAVNCLNKLHLKPKSEKENILLSKAITGFLYNAVIGEGKLKNYISLYPNRGAYPTHFLWDTCFQNTALEKMSDELTENSLLQFAANQRSDGKYPQFMCSTWDRPSFTQPALVGWALMRYLKTFPDIRATVQDKKEFLHTMLLSLSKNNEWWLTARMTRFGVIYCPHGLETGQDDSPRFDKGATLACDMNAFLLNQMNCTGELAELLGEAQTAVYWRKKAKELSQNMVKVLFDEADGIFYDCNAENGEKIKVLCCSCFFPLWAGAELPSDKVRFAVENYLLSEKHFFSFVPFPSVSYSDSTYEPSLWWRGPMWFPTALILLETLHKSGYEKEEKQASERLYNILVNDGNFREHFNSRTGEGEGAYDQGWTQAIFIYLWDK